MGRNVLLNFELCKGPWHKKRIINKIKKLKKKKKNYGNTSEE